jgi:hypothetical protein
MAKHYALATIEGYIDDVYLACTHHDLVAGVIARVFEIYPDVKITYFHAPEEMRFINVINRQKNDRVILPSFIWWIAAQLCEQGWEPFSESRELGPAGTTAPKNTFHMCFRKEIE